MKRALMTASVVSMIEQFNKSNLDILLSLGYTIDIACNFEEGNSSSKEKILALKEKYKNDEVAFHQIDFSRSPLSVLKNFKAYRQLKKLLSENRYDLIHCHTPVCGVITRFAANKYRSYGTKVIYTAHGFHFYKGAPLLNWILYYPLELLSSKFTDAVITVNKEDYALASRKFTCCRSYYIPGVGIDMDRFSKIPSREERKKTRSELEINDDDIVIMSVGELNKNKNHQIIIKAISNLKSEPYYEKIKYMIIGKGPMDSSLKKLADELGVKLDLLGYRSDIDKLLNAADMFAFPSVREGLPVSLMEAMCENLPIITSSNRGAADLFENGIGGQMCACMDDKGFSEGIKKIIQNEFSFGTINRDNVCRFDIKIVNEIMKKIYTEI